MQSQDDKTSSSSAPASTSNTILPDTVANIRIIPVKCDPSEPQALKEGVTELFKAYFDELYELGCDLGFQGFQNEWLDLPGKYDFDKRGGLYVAVAINASSSEAECEQLKMESKHVVGCIAIRPLEGDCGEVKRMYIRKSHRRNGIGKKLAETIMDHAWNNLNYKELKLDSLERLKGAVALYENLGFEKMDEPYCECPEDDHVCMNLFRNMDT